MTQEWLAGGYKPQPGEVRCMRLCAWIEEWLQPRCVGELACQFTTCVLSREPGECACGLPTMINRLCQVGLYLCYEIAHVPHALERHVD